jgi:hypothetical protein
MVFLSSSSEAGVTARALRSDRFGSRGPSPFLDVGLLKLLQAGLEVDATHEKRLDFTGTWQGGAE